MPVYHVPQMDSLPNRVLHRRAAGTDHAGPFDVLNLHGIRVFAAPPAGLLCPLWQLVIWRSEDNPATWDLFLGSVDEEWLVGDKAGQTTEGGSVVEHERPTEAVGRKLCTPNQFQFWWENVVPGVTDHVTMRDTGGRMIIASACLERRNIVLGVSMLGLYKSLLVLLLEATASF